VYSSMKREHEPRRFRGSVLKGVGHHEEKARCSRPHSGVARHSRRLRILLRGFVEADFAADGSRGKLVPGSKRRASGPAGEGVARRDRGRASRLTVTENVRTIGKLLLLPALAALSAGITLTAGFVDFSASRPPSRVEERLAAFALHRSIARRAPRVTNPLADSEAAAAAGLVLYRAHCVVCHGAPGVDPSEGGASLNPPAPGLTLGRVQARSDGELKWIVSNGIRMTGMPGFGASRSEEEVWQLVAALRRLPRLSPEESRVLGEGAGANAGSRAPRS